MTEYRNPFKTDKQNLFAEYYQAKLLADQEPDVEVGDKIIRVRDGNTVCEVSIAENTWHGTCEYAQENDVQTHPCRHVRAVERWMYEGKLATSSGQVLNIGDLARWEMVMTVVQCHQQLEKCALGTSLNHIPA